MDIVAFTDGGSRGNPGLGGVGVVIQRNNTVIAEFRGIIDFATNNEAEYSALILALDYAVKNNANSLVVLSDSQLMVRQMDGVYAVNDRLRPFYVQAKSLAAKIPQFFITHIPRHMNAHADRLANEAMDAFERKII